MCIYFKMPSSPTHGHGTLSSVTMQSVQYLVDDAFPVRFDRPQARVGIPIPNVVCAQLLTQMVDMRDPVAAIGSRSEGILVGTPVSTGKQTHRERERQGIERKCWPRASWLFFAMDAGSCCPQRCQFWPFKKKTSVVGREDND